VVDAQSDIAFNSKVTKPEKTGSESSAQDKMHSAAYTGRLLKLSRGAYMEQGQSYLAAPHTLTSGF